MMTVVNFLCLLRILCCSARDGTGACELGNFEIDNEWSIINGMRRDAKMTTKEDGGSRETAQLELSSTAAAGGLPDGAGMRLFFKYNGEYHR